MKRHALDRTSGRNRWGWRRGEVALELEADAPVATLPAPRHFRDNPAIDATPWVIVLAGGEGRRLRAYTTLKDGVSVPKQFCRFRDERTLLGATIDRALRLTPADHVMVVVVEAHREWWERELDRLPATNVLVQPQNRGTAVALLHALVHIHLRDRSARVVVMPSDHDFEDESTLVRSVGRALETAERFPHDIVLLGIRPSHLDAEYGLITPGAGGQDGSRPVRAFVEKPSLTVAAQLAHDGALWNSFIFASTGSALYDMFVDALPWVASTYLQGLVTNGGEPAAMAATFSELPECDFSRDLLQRYADRLRLVEVPPCGWTDLGTPARLAAWLDRHREASFWREQGVPRLRGTEGLPDALQAGGA